MTSNFLAWLESACLINAALPPTHAAPPAIASGITMDSYPGPLGQIISNLINNALVHGLENKAAGLISISARARPNGWVELIVSDDGCGIPKSHLGRIFDPFFTTKLGQGGSGLGLHIVHNLTTNVLGGTIRVDSVLQAHTRFILELPCVAPNHQPEQKPPNPE